MFPHHPLWSITIDILLHMLLFIVVVSLIVFTLRGPMRKYKPADLRIFEKLQTIRNKTNDRLMLAITALGNQQFLIPANLSLIAGFLFFGSHHWYASRILAMSLSSLLLMFLLKQLFHRRRPQTPLLFQAKGMSFPSGHAIMSVCFYGLLCYMLQQTTVAPFIKSSAIVFTVLLALLIGFSRVYLQVHYASDVLAGFIIGICWFYVSLHVLQQLEGFS